VKVADHPLHCTWRMMLQRCENPRYTFYDRYGGRGIKVCERWHVFANFVADMGARPERKTLDRIDNDGNYEPGNCRWATGKEQQANRRRKHFKRDISGTRFGLLVVREFSHLNAMSYWLCGCDCGGTCIKRVDVLKGGLAKSCGCQGAKPRRLIFAGATP
jgi:hypothetical protein